MAFAQHIGLPTTMLDWTRRATVAAYFAVDEAARMVTESKRARSRGQKKPAKPPTHFAIWALCVDAFGRMGDREMRPFLYQPPSASNPNLHAQAGLLSVSLDDDAKSLERQLTGQNVIKRIVAPTSEAPKLLRLLHLEGVDGGAMFPGPYGVLRAMKETMRWDKPPPARVP